MEEGSQAITLAPRAELARTSPAEQIAFATECATLLGKAIAAKPNPVKFGGEIYLEFEDWQLLNYFYGFTVEVEWTRPISIDTLEGAVRGWEARAVLLRGGVKVSAAEAMCLDDEDKWDEKTIYEWMPRSEAEARGLEVVKEDGARVRARVGTEPVPEFQRRSMAQTRACSKVSANVHRWIVALMPQDPKAARVRGTPAEEMPRGAAPPQAAPPGPAVAPGAPLPPTQAPQGPAEGELVGYEAIVLVKEFQKPQPSGKVRVSFQDQRGRYFYTFEAPFAATLKQFMEAGTPCNLTAVHTRFGEEVRTIG